MIDMHPPIILFRDYKLGRGWSMGTEKLYVMLYWKGLKLSFRIRDWEHYYYYEN